MWGWCVARTSCAALKCYEMRCHITLCRPKVTTKELPKQVVPPESTPKQAPKQVVPPYSANTRKTAAEKLEPQCCRETWTSESNSHGKHGQQKPFKKHSCFVWQGLVLWQDHKKILTVNENNQAMQAPSSVPVSKTAHEIAMLATPGNGGRGATSQTSLLCSACWYRFGFRKLPVF